MNLIALDPKRDGYILDLKYATPNNVTGKSIYQSAHSYIHADAYPLLLKAQEQALSLGMRLKIYDCFRPCEAQDALWATCPDANFVTPPDIGSPHSRGVAVDLTLIDDSGQELEMGTPFDDFTTDSFHGCQTISIQAQKNRLILCGIMTVAGWQLYSNEWWHYHLPNHTSYPLVKNGQLPRSMM